MGCLLNQIIVPVWRSITTFHMLNSLEKVVEYLMGGKYQRTENNRQKKQLQKDKSENGTLQIPIPYFSPFSFLFKFSFSGPSTWVKTASLSSTSSFLPFHVGWSNFYFTF